MDSGHSINDLTELVTSFSKSRDWTRYHTPPNLLKVEKSYRVTGLRAVEHRRASHIKPWRVSGDSEKVDEYNGLLLSSHTDHLFARGWITFLDEGHLKPSPRLDALVLQSWRVEPDRNPPPFKGDQQVYLEYHREVVFKS